MKSVNRSQCVERNNKGDIKMKKQMKRTVYEAPVTERFSVELEGGFMSASIMEDTKHSSGVETTSQGFEELSGNAWNENGSANANSNISWD